MTDEKKNPTQEEVGRLKQEFLERLGAFNIKLYKQPFVIVIGGAPGSGKTTAAKTMSSLSESAHVQANSARYLLGEHGFAWGENVRLVIQAVLENILARGWSVVLDGMLLQDEERRLVKKTADKHGAKIFFNAIRCEPEIAEQRARERYVDGKFSSFEDWRCKPEKFEEYIASIAERTVLLEDLLLEIPNNLNEGIWPMDNNGNKRDLVGWIEPVWDQIKKKL